MKKHLSVILLLLLCVCFVSARSSNWVRPLNSFTGSGVSMWEDDGAYISPNATFSVNVNASSYLINGIDLFDIFITEGNDTNITSQEIENYGFMLNNSNNHYQMRYLTLNESLDSQNIRLNGNLVMDSSRTFYIESIWDIAATNQIMELGQGGGARVYLPQATTALNGLKLANSTIHESTAGTIYISGNLEANNNITANNLFVNNDYINPNSEVITGNAYTGRWNHIGTWAAWGHEDTMNSTGAAVLQSPQGGTILNSNGGQTVQMRIANDNAMVIQSDKEVEIQNKLLVGASGNPSEILQVYGTSAGDGAQIGGVYIGYWDFSANYATVTHNSLKGNTNDYALLQSGGGATFLNAKSGETISFRIANNNGLILTSSRGVQMPEVYSDTVGATNRDLYIDSSGNIGYVSSSERYKENIENLTGSDRIYKLRPVTYDRKDGSNNGEVGLIAEEVAKVFPEAVSNKTIRYYRYDDTRGQVLDHVETTQIPETVNYERLIVPLLKEVQELRKEIEQLKKEKM